MYVFDKQTISKDLKEMIMHCINNCKKIDIPISNNIKFYMKKSERQNGCCTTWRKIDKHEIMISNLLLNRSEIENTIYHELLHSCPNCANHGRIWQHYGDMIYKAYGQKMNRCDNKQRAVVDPRHSRRLYYSKEEYEAYPGILCKIVCPELENKVLGYCKSGSRLVKRTNDFTYQGHPIAIIR